MAALSYLLETLARLCLMAVLCRLLLQWTRADFRNPLVRALVQLTNPLIVPIRRIVPAVGRVDTASVLLIVAFAMVTVAIPALLRDFGLPAPEMWALRSAGELLRTLLWIYFIAILLHALVAMIAPGAPSPAAALAAAISEPVLERIRRWIPTVGGLDLSPLWALILIQTLLILVQSVLP